MTVLDQNQYLGSLGNVPQLLAFLRDWATGVNGQHEILNPDGSQASYQQVLQDLRDNRHIDVSSLPQNVIAPPPAAAAPILWTPDQEASYQNQLRSAQTARDQDIATNDYARFVSQQRGSRALSDLNTQYDRQRSTMPGSFVGRGVYGSGIWQDALNRYASDRYNAVQRQTEDNNNANRQYDVNASNIQAAYASKAADLAANKQGQISNLAAQLSAAKPYTV